jgi:chromosome segregation ATPase
MSKENEDSAAPRLELARDLTRLQGAFSGLGLLFPGFRAKRVRTLARAEQALRESQEAEDEQAQIAEATVALGQSLKTANQFLLKVHALTEKHLGELLILQQTLDARLSDVQQAAETHLDLAKREEDLRKREAGYREAMNRLQQQQGEMVVVQRDTQASLKDAHALQASSQATQAEVHRQTAQLARDLSDLDQRRSAQEEFKAHLISRQDAVARTEDNLAMLAKQRDTLQSELVSLKMKAMDKVAEGEKLIREREIALVKREEETNASNLLQAERERALRERERELDDREVGLSHQKTALEAARAECDARERRIDELKASVAALNGQRDELNRLVASLSAKL